MPRLKSDDKRSAILAAAARLIAMQGLVRRRWVIAKGASIPNGSMFTYFQTKAGLFNQLYLELKAEMAIAALQDVQQSGFAVSTSFRSGGTGRIGLSLSLRNGGYLPN